MGVNDLFNLKGKRVLVTGSSDGIGKAIAFALAEYGASVVFHGGNDINKCQSACDELEALGYPSSYIVANLADDESLETIQVQVPHVDILVINAAIQVREDFFHVSREQFDQQVQVNFWGTFRLIQQFAKGMKAQGWGRILTIGSVQQEKPHPQMPIYAAIKSGIANLVKNLSLQLALDGITVNNIAPGVIHTARNTDALADQDYAAKVKTKIPLGFTGDPQDCAGIALLLCSEAGRYITGQSIYCDGGMSI